MKQIITAIQDGGKGGLVRLFDNNNNCFQVISTFSDGVLTGYTSSSVTIKSGNDVRTYDSSGSQIAQYITSNNENYTDISNDNLQTSGDINDAITFIGVVTFLFTWYCFYTWVQSLLNIPWTFCVFLSLVILSICVLFLINFVSKMFKKH